MIDLRVCHHFDRRLFVQGKGHWEEKVYNLCLPYTFYMEKHWFVLHINIAYDLRVGHDLSQKSFINLKNE